MIKEICGVDPIEMVINSYLGIENKVNLIHNNSVYCTCLLYMSPGKFSKIIGLDALEKENVIHKAFITKGANEQICDDLRSGNRVGAMVFKGKNCVEVLEKEKIALARISVLNDSNEDVLLRNLYNGCECTFSAF